MLNRRHLRIKLLHTLYADKQGSFSSVQEGEKQLMESTQKFRELYFYLLSLFGDVLFAAQTKIEDGKKKRLPSEEDLNPNMRFVENKPLMALANNRDILAHKDHFGIDIWSEEPELIKHLLKIAQDSEMYVEFMQSTERSFKADLTLLVGLFRKLWINDEKLHFYLEEKSILWTDDLDLCASMVLKTLKGLEEETDEHVAMLPLFRDEKDDKAYMQLMYKQANKEWEKHVELISEITPNWETERIALIDMLLLNLAVTEARFCKDIPVKVTINEFIEISKYYSTPKSKTFLNGVLDKLFAKLKQDGEIKKIGRGLIE